MAKKVPEGKRFKPGQSGNPKGRPPMIPEFRDIKKISPSHIKVVIDKYMRLNRAEIKNALEQPGTSMMECVIGSIIVKAMQDGDYSRLNFLLDRSIGKVKDQLEVQSQHIVYKTSFTPEGNLVQQIMDIELDGLPEGSTDK